MSERNMGNDGSSPADLGRDLPSATIADGSPASAPAASRQAHDDVLAPIAEARPADWAGGVVWSLTEVVWSLTEALAVTFGEGELAPQPTAPGQSVRATYRGPSPPAAGRAPSQGPSRTTVF